MLKRLINTEIGVYMSTVNSAVWKIFHIIIEKRVFESMLFCCT